MAGREDLEAIMSKYWKINYNKNYRLHKIICLLYISSQTITIILGTNKFIHNSETVIGV